MGEQPTSRLARRIRSCFGIRWSPAIPIAIAAESLRSDRFETTFEYE
jgi:hypothetical protein